MSLPINELLRHYRVVNHEKFRSSCCVHGCNDYFRTFSALKSHIYWVHKQLVQETSIVIVGITLDLHGQSLMYMYLCMVSTSVITCNHINYC